MVKYVETNGRKIKQLEPGDKIRVGNLSYILIVDDQQWIKWKAKLDALVDELGIDLPTIRIHALEHQTLDQLKWLDEKE